ncbi:bifunctional transcriptional activator/DNA repair enzyme AdaA [Lactiplantibacillus daowaiensis]|uniref:Bifunctional transcriptional activator/DNA repair enzyme AdaA n=1 Tax=Lactiplantibacillus daowaiensis TaxID=2559918 RepID=A0ABW1RXM6_9LACO|nr:Ada metal-binding domain-containing protein [Lactiplantibacillus daowaiensis]
MAKLTAAQWQAIQQNSPQADGQFFYGVTSTGIFCRPSCHSRLPRRDHIQSFKTATAAMAAEFRPCKRCRPTGLAVTPVEWVTEIDTIIATHYGEKLTLTELAQLAHGDPYYLHHVYRQQTGQTPLAALKQVRLQRAQQLLVQGELPIKTVAERCGFQTSAYFSTSFKQAYGQTPREYRQNYRDS